MAIAATLDNNTSSTATMSSSIPATSSATTIPPDPMQQQQTNSPPFPSTSSAQSHATMSRVNFCLDSQVVASSTIPSPSLQPMSLSHRSASGASSVSASIPSASSHTSSIALNGSTNRHHPQKRSAAISIDDTNISSSEDNDDSSRSSDPIDPHLDCCLICGGIGELLECDTCQFVYHMKCVGMKRIPEGLWQCDLCLNRATITQYRLERQARRQHPEHYAAQRQQQRMKLKQQRKQQHAELRAAPQRLTRAAARATAVIELDTVEEEEDIAGAIAASSSNAAGTATSSPTPVDAPVTTPSPTTPSDQLANYDDDGPECAFCHAVSPSYSSGYSAPHRNDPLANEERFLGPFHDERGIRFYAHRACCMWSPRVFVRDGMMMNVVEEVTRAKWLRCAECKKLGASIGCCEKSCPKSFHYQCAKEAQCCMILPSYKLYCVDHAVTHNLRAKFESDGADTTMLLPSAVINQRLANVVQCVAAQVSGSPDQFIIRKKDIGFYQAASVYDQFLSTVTAARLKKEARFAHLKHLPYDDRRRRTKAELRIKSVDEEEQEKEKEERKRKRDMNGGEDEEERERQKRKMEDDEKQLDEMNSSHLPPVEDSAAAPSTSSALSWSDIGGLSSQISSLHECVLLPLLYPDLFATLHVTPPKGIILVGPPGTGKTMLARALAKTCATAMGGRPITFFARKGADVLSRFHGDAELTLRTLFDIAKRRAPSVIYFDEIDGLTPVRSAKQNQVHASVVTTLLSLMDGLTPSGQVFVLASTNRIDAIDPALRRPGRFDREVYVGNPNEKQRKEIINIHTREWPKESKLSEENLMQLAAQTVGYSGADIRALCSEAALLAAHRVIGPQLLSSSSSSTLIRDPDILTKFPHVHVTSGDLKSALSRFSSSLRRHDANQPQSMLGTSAAIMQLMQPKLREAKSILDLPVTIQESNQTEQKEKENVMMIEDDTMEDESKANSSSPLSLPLSLVSTIHRLLICGSSPAPLSRVFTNTSGELEQHEWHITSQAHSPALLATSLLSHFDMESCVVHHIDLPSLALDEHALNLAEALVRKFAQANPKMTNVFYLPRLDEWWTQTSIPSLHPLRGALISCLRNLTSSTQSTPVSSSTCTIFLATSTCDRTDLLSLSDLHPFLRDFFRSNTTVSFHKPSPIATQAFFTTAMKDTAVRYGEYAKQLVELTTKQIKDATGDATMNSAENIGESKSEESSETNVQTTVDASASIVTSFDTFLTASSSSFTSLITSLKQLASHLDYTDFHRLQFEIDQWLHREMDELRQQHKQHGGAANETDDAFIKALRLQTDVPWNSLLTRIHAFFHGRIEAIRSQ